MQINRRMDKSINIQTNKQIRKLTVITVIRIFTNDHMQNPQPNTPPLPYSSTSTSTPASSTTLSSTQVTPPPPPPP